MADSDGPGRSRLSARRPVPRARTVRLWSQLTRAAASVPANIAESHGRQGTRESANFVSIARGSLAELETFVLLAERLGYVTPEETATPQEPRRRSWQTLSVASLNS